MENRQPAILLNDYQALRNDPGKLSGLPPCQAFAMLGQAKAAGLLESEEESRLLGKLLTHWALHHSLDFPVAGSGQARATLFVT